MKKIILVILTVALLAFCGCESKNVPQIQLPTPTGEFGFTILKSGQADAILLKTANHNVIIDCGEQDDGDEVVKHLSENNISKIDYLFITHFDKDHVGGFPEVMDNVTASNIIVPDYVGNNEEYEEYLKNIFDKESDNQIKEICEITEIISETPKYMSKKERIKKIVFELLSVLIITIMLFVWMWISVIFLASLFAFLDGIKLYGISIVFLGLDILFFWLTIMLNRMLFKKKNVYKTNLIIIISSVAIIAIGIALFIYQMSKVEHESDVTLKYNMTTKYDTYKLPTNEEEKMYIFFNSNYDTQYMIKYDDNLDGKFKLEVKYYENYYDYNMKKSSNNLYVSLSVDPRDRISSYIDDFKENKIYNEKELSRYTVKITINEKDYQRLVIQN